MPQPPHDDVRGFLPDGEGLRLYEWALETAVMGPILEIGSYCGRSTIWLAQAAKEKQSLVFAVDHHRGSEEHQPGESHHDTELVDAKGDVDTLTMFRRNIRLAGLENEVIPVVTDSTRFARSWSGQLGMVFIDGGHSLSAALADFRAWAPRVLPGGFSPSTMYSRIRQKAAKPLHDLAFSAAVGFIRIARGHRQPERSQENRYLSGVNRR